LPLNNQQATSNKQPVLPAEAFFVLPNEMKEEAEAGNMQPAIMILSCDGQNTLIICIFIPCEK